MARNRVAPPRMGHLQRTATAIKKLFSRRSRKEESFTAAPQPQRNRSRASAPRAARYARRQADIPLDILDGAYTPPLTSSKASFRSDGADHQLDQEFAFGVADERWNDEDRYTNKSGDPRIGTHRRTYEPTEQSAKTHE